METINGQLYRVMVINAANHLYNNHKIIDALNVFPVPDGDTGTNMNLTMKSGVNAVFKDENLSLQDVSKAFSKGLLMGARGNSGVILSQIFRGIAKGFEGHDEANVQTIAKAFVEGNKVAYQAVMRPVEGTILTVIRESSISAQKLLKKQKDKSVAAYFELLCEQARISLNNTPNLLPVLKEAGVVDSGGEGLCIILEAFKMALQGVTIQASETELQVEKIVETNGLKNSDHEEFGYCTEFILELSKQGKKKFSERKMQEDLLLLGDSAALVCDDDIVKVHVHTLRPGKVLELGQKYGEFITLKIENMSVQHDHLATNEAKVSREQKVELKENGLIAVSSGSGISDFFNELHCDQIISGGQTMNPSTEDFIEAINKVNAKNIYILPNNSNIIMAANQAATLIEDKIVHVFSTKTITQGMAAAVLYNPDGDYEHNVEEMQSAITHVKSGQITTAIKTTVMDGIAISENDYLAISEGKIVSSNESILQTSISLLEGMLDDESEILTVVFGKDATEEYQKQLKDYIENQLEIEVEYLHGQQPVYFVLFGVE